MRADSRPAPPAALRRRAGAILSLLLVALLAGASGCAGIGVEPWERDLLAQDAMSLDADHVDAAFDAHIYFSKEASTGGASLGGGGCGCN